MSAPALDKRCAHERDHRLAPLIVPGIADRHYPPVWTAVGSPQIDDLGGIGHGITDVDWLDPFQFAKPRRRTKHGHAFAARAQAFVLAFVALDHQAHPHRGGMPTRGAERAE